MKTAKMHLFEPKTAFSKKKPANMQVSSGFIRNRVYFQKKNCIFAGIAEGHTL
ncbi:hypothetical protein M3201_20400 [Paenibacillus motobuensis]|uniref:hypothetical protein n=1 Tax=Paenibacillus TaxID=44249 RepID=UPI002041C129|nr:MULTISPECIES: hypothetical protein [Paenibacillus]MCM3042042.1 hypothetical protein [Paenibacillus lutimineralis]MCM3649146.1 hypothetical protein [Paenibacillus motobuensis]